MKPTKAVLITGASKGIGRAAALHLDQLGLRVFAGVRKQVDADSLTQAASANLTPIFIDVTKPEMIAAAAETIAAQVGDDGLWGLVNNAGVAVAGPIEFLPVDEYRRQFEINFFGQIAVTQAFMPLIRKAAGRIVNISSMSGHFASPFLSPYSTSKHSIEALSDALRRELMPFGIKVAVVEPSNTATPIWDTAMDKAEALKAKFPPEALRLYSRVFEVMESQTSDTGEAGIPPIKIARAVAHALTARRPRIRYAVGFNAKLVIWTAHLLPDRLLDWIVKMRVYRRT